MAKRLCLHCGTWFEVSELVPVFEEGKDDFIRWYCKKCLPEVKEYYNELPWKHLYRFGDEEKK